MHYLRTLVTNGDNELFFLQQCPLPLDTQFFCVCVCVNSLLTHCQCNSVVQ